MVKEVVELGREKEVLIPGPAMRSSASKKELPCGTFLMALLNASPSADTETS
jgi:hypothetical protein